MTNTPNTLSGTLQMFRQTSTITRARLRILTDMRERDQAVFWADWTQIPRDGRARIVQLLNEISEDNVDLDFRPVMRWLLADSDAEVRRRAIEGLSEEEQPRVIEPLLALMNGDPDPTVRIAAALGLARFTELAAMEELTPATSAQLRQALMTALIAEVNNVDLYRRILEALGWVSDDAVSSAVRMAWQSDKGALRESALVAMGRSGDTSWLPMVRDGLERGTPGVRYEAARACGDFADQAAALVPLLIVASQDDDVEIAVAAIDSLGSIGDERSLKVLKQHAAGRDAAKREAAMAALEDHEGAGDVFGGWKPGPSDRDRAAFETDDDDDEE
jgi:HEAT repeat protein